MAPVTRGRFLVRCMSLSMSRSMNMLMALAPPAASAPPSRVAPISHTGGRPRWATIMVGSVVISSSSMMRGLVSATYAPTRDPSESRRGRATAGSAIGETVVPTSPGRH